MGLRINNVGRRVPGLGYADAKVSIEEEMEIFDGLPKPLRSVITEMPARANVLKYERLWHQQGLGQALDYARRSVQRFYDAASAEKATGEYWQ